MNDIGKYVLGTIHGILLIVIILYNLCYVIDRIMLIYVNRSDKRKLLHNVITLAYGIVGFIGLCFVFSLHDVICLFAVLNHLIYNMFFPLFGNEQMKLEYVLIRILNITEK